MYLKSLALQTGNNPPTFSEPVIIGASKCRTSRIRRTFPGHDTGRVERTQIVDINALILSVDRILSAALLNAKQVQVELLQYVE